MPRKTCDDVGERIHTKSSFARWLNPVSPPFDAGGQERTLEMVSPFLPSCQPRSSPNLRSLSPCPPCRTPDWTSHRCRAGMMTITGNCHNLGRNVNNFQTHFFNSDNLLSHLNEIVILSKDEIIRKWLLSGSRLKGKSADCPQARAVEMGRGGLMVGDNETIKGENGQIVRGGGLSASEGGSGGICPDEHCYLFILPLLPELIGKGGQVRWSLFYKDTIADRELPTGFYLKDNQLSDKIKVTRNNAYKTFTETGKLINLHSY